MSSRALSVPSTAQLVRLAVLLVALLGLFAMHGLATHGTTHGPSAGGLSMAESSAGSPHAGHDGSSPREGEGQSTTAGSHGEKEKQDGSDASLLGLCLAVLAAVLLGVLGAHLRRTWTCIHLACANLNWSLPPGVARRDRDPPNLYSLSIQRC